MTAREREMVARLRARVKQQGSLLIELAQVLHTHVRTDLPLDACLPRMGRLLKKIRGAR